MNSEKRETVRLLRRALLGVVAAVIALLLVIVAGYLAVRALIALLPGPAHADLTAAWGWIVLALLLTVVAHALMALSDRLYR